MHDRERPSTAALHLRAVVLPEEIERDLYIVAGRFTYERPDAPVTTVFVGGYMLPGLVDAHAHLDVSSPAPPEASPEERVRASAHAHLAAGVLALREPGGPHDASRGIGPHEGLPRIVTAGRFLAPSGRYFLGLNARWAPGGCRGAGPRERGLGEGDR
jgi:imidazolonepropionase-like amidohydrolase